MFGSRERLGKVSNATWPRPTQNPMPVCLFSLMIIIN